MSNVRYTDDNANPITYYDFAVDEAWKGDFVKGDIITVGQAGGYIRGDVFVAVNGHKDFEDNVSLTENDFVKENPDGTPFPTEGEQRILFIRHGAEGLYYAISGFMGVYFIDGVNVSRYLPPVDAGLYSGFSYTPDPDTIDGLRDFVKTVSEYDFTFHIPTFAEIKENGIEIMKIDTANSDIDALIAFYDEKIAFVKKTASEADYHPRILFLDYHSTLYASGGDTFRSVMIETAGGINPAKEFVSMGAVTKVTMQQILEWDPEIVFFPNYSYFEDNEITDDPEWQKTAAVQSGNVYRFPSNRGAWDTASDYNNNMAFCLGLLYMTHIIYPQAYSLEQLEADAMTYYALEGYPVDADVLGLK